jgi:hypothetical protein
VAAIGGVAAVVTVIAWQQIPRFRDQVWFFGRASRNIRDQHMVAARRLARLRPPPHRVLVGDAGAIPYVSGLAALDIIGLGGYADLPFARASRWGVAAALELVERMSPADRPDALAIYPTWWGDFPAWFGEAFDSVPVQGNVICGGKTKVLYRADWRPLEHSAVPGRLGDRTETIGSLDFADIVSEQEGGYSIEGALGYITMKMLPDPERPSAALWDAGRVVPAGAAVRFVITGFTARRPAILRFRVAPAQGARLQVRVGEGSPLEAALPAADGWLHVDVPIPADRVDRALGVRVTALGQEVVLYHAWGLQSP